MTAPAAENEGLRHLAGASTEWLRILEINPDAILVLSRDERIAFANRAAARVFGVEREALAGRRMIPHDWGMTTPDGIPVTEEESPFRRVLREGGGVRDIEVVIRRADGERVQLAVNAAVLGAGEAGRSLIASIRDVTQRRRGEAHARLLAEAGRVLASLLEPEAMMEGLAALIVPAFADWVVLDMLEAEGIRRFTAMRRDRETPAIRSCVMGYPLAEPVARVVRKRTSVLLSTLTADVMQQYVRDADRIEELRALHARSLLCVPLIARGRVEGAFTFITTERSYDELDRDLAEQLAARLGLAVSNTRLYRAAQEATAEAAAQHRRAAEILESITDAFWAVDPEWRFTYVNRHAERVLGQPREELIGRRMRDVFPDAGSSLTQLELERAAELGTPCVFELKRPVLGTWFEVHAYPSASGVSVYLHDIDARKKAEAARELLVNAGIALSKSLDTKSVLAHAARAGIPHLADFCTIDVLDGTETIVRAACAALDPDTEAQLARLGRRHPPDARLPSAAMTAVRTNAPVLTDLSTPALMAEAPDPELLRYAQELDARSALTVPLGTRGRALGAITFVYARSGRLHDAELFELAGDLARRVATGLDNARLYEEAQASSRAKTNFIGVISHEFRTPLTAVIGYADLLLAELAGPLSDKQNEQLERIKASAWHLTNLVEEILTFSRMEAGREHVEIEPVNLVDVAQKAAMLIEPVAASKGLALTVDVPIEPLITHTDPGKVRQILVNLLGNAVKFTDEGEVRLRACEQERRYVFEVSDTGIGIAAEDRERIFDSFWQVDQGPTRRVVGTGLGLTIARRLARLLGGEIDVASELGHGSRFTVLLPIPGPGRGSEAPMLRTRQSATT